MGAYTTEAAILGEINQSDLIGLTDDQSTGELNSTVLDQVIANASGEIDRMVSAIYTVPFDPIPTAVASMTLIIACYRLYRRRLVPDEKNLFYEDYRGVVDFLEKVNEGEAHIDLTAEREFSQVAVSGRGTVYGGMGSNCLSNSM